MNLFRKSKKIEFSEKEVIIYEMDVKSFIKLQRGEYKDDLELIADNSSLSLEELKNINFLAYQKILEEFYKLNDVKEENGEEVDEKK